MVEYLGISFDDQLYSKEARNEKIKVVSTGYFDIACVRACSVNLYILEGNEGWRVSEGITASQVAFYAVSGQSELADSHKKESFSEETRLVAVFCDKLTYFI